MHRDVNFSFSNFVEIFGRVKNDKSQTSNFFCWVLENEFEYFFLFSIEKWRPLKNLRMDQTFFVL
jgi:hypothetical protein